MKFPLWLSFASGWVGWVRSIWTDSGCLERLYMLTSDLIPQKVWNNNVKWTSLLSARLVETYIYIFPIIDLFGLYILFSHFRPRDATRGNSFFQMSSYARANLRITNEKTKGKFPWGHHVVWNGKTKCTSRKGLLAKVSPFLTIFYCIFLSNKQLLHHMKTTNFFYSTLYQKRSKTRIENCRTRTSRGANQK